MKKGLQFTIIFAIVILLAVCVLFLVLRDNPNEEPNSENVQNENIETNNETPTEKESVEEHEQEEEPIAEEEPKQEEKPVVKEEPKQEEKPVVKEEPKQEVSKKENIVSNVETLYVKSIDISPITESSTTIDKAEIVTYSGTISTENQVDKYTFTVPRDGMYRFELSGMKSGFTLDLYVLDSLGKTIADNTWARNGSGLTVYDLKKGDTYEIQIIEDEDTFGDYTLSIGCQKTIVDITEFNKINDSVEFTDQINIYTFTVPRDGRYRFELSGMKSGLTLDLYILDSLGKSIANDTWARNGSGLTVYDLKKGDTYEIQVLQDEDLFGSYTLSIGCQKPIIDITEFNKINDSVEFTDQRNVYTFTVPCDGRYRFELSEVKSGLNFDLYVFDSLEESIAKDTSARNGSGLTVYDLKQGDTYEIQVRQNEGVGNYSLLIGYQKPSLDISSADKVKGNISFTDQRDVYTFTAKDTSAKNFKLSGMENECKVKFMIFNNLGEVVSQDDYAVNGDTVTIKKPVSGEIYEIQVSQENGYSNYTITIN